MKKIFLVLLAFSMFQFSAWAYQSDAADEVASKPVDTKLVNLDISRLNSKTNDLEKRIENLERDKKYQDDQLRSMQRDISDLKRQR